MLLKSNHSISTHPTLARTDPPPKFSDVLGLAQFLSTKPSLSWYPGVVGKMEDSPRELCEIRKQLARNPNIGVLGTDWGWAFSSGLALAEDCGFCCREDSQ